MARVFVFFLLDVLLFKIDETVLPRSTSPLRGCAAAQCGKPPAFRCYPDKTAARLSLAAWTHTLFR
jgi:hypothetical protein